MLAIWVLSWQKGNFMEYIDRHNSYFFTNGIDEAYSDARPLSFWFAIDLERRANEL